MQIKLKKKKEKKNRKQKQKKSPKTKQEDKKNGIWRRPHFGEKGVWILVGGSCNLFLPLSDSPLASPLARPPLASRLCLSVDTWRPLSLLLSLPLPLSAFCHCLHLARNFLLFLLVVVVPVVFFFFSFILLVFQHLLKKRQKIKKILKDLEMRNTWYFFKFIFKKKFLKFQKKKIILEIKILEIELKSFQN